jgi:hypothetical protein
MELVQTTLTASIESELDRRPVTIAAGPQDSAVSAWVWEHPHKKALAALCYTSTLKIIPRLIGRYFNGLESYLRQRS